MGNEAPAFVQSPIDATAAPSFDSPYTNIDTRILNRLNTHRQFTNESSEQYSPAGWREGEDHIDQMWSIHLKLCPDINKEVERWKDIAEGILVFTGLFSAMVAALLIANYQNILPSSSSSSNAIAVKPLLEGVIPAESLISMQPTRAVNLLWLSGLCISVSCALCAIIVKEWARRFERLCSRKPEYGESPEAKARLRLQAISSVSLRGVSAFIHALMAILHIAVALFFIGLLEVFWSIDKTVTAVVFAVELLFGIMYIWFTILPLIDDVSVIQTPLTTVMWSAYVAVGGAYIAFETILSHLKAASTKSKVSLQERFRESIDSSYRFTHAYFNAVDYSFIKVANDFTDAELQGLVSTFDDLRITSVADFNKSISNFRTFLLGICSILSLNPARNKAICMRILDHPPSTHPGLLTTWEAWIITILHSYDPLNVQNAQLIALCMRIHYHVLLNYSLAKDNVLSRLEGCSYFERRILNALKDLETHARLSVAISARCMRACLAVYMAPARFDMDCSLAQDFIASGDPQFQADISRDPIDSDIPKRAEHILDIFLHDIQKIEARRSAIGGLRESGRVTISDGYLEVLQHDIQDGQVEGIKQAMIISFCEIITAASSNEALPTDDAKRLQELLSKYGIDRKVLEQLKQERALAQQATRVHPSRRISAPSPVAQPLPPQTPTTAHRMPHFAAGAITRGSRKFSAGRKGTKDAPDTRRGSEPNMHVDTMPNVDKSYADATYEVYEGLAQQLHNQPTAV